MLSTQRRVLEEGLEPTLLSELDPKSSASANFAIRAENRASYTTAARDSRNRKKTLISYF